MSKPKGKTQVRVTILYGLPGSGKTYFAAQSNRMIPVVDLDAITNVKGTNKFAVLTELGKQVDTKLCNYSYRYANSVIVDGLITTNSQLRDVIDSLTANLSRYQVIFYLVYWNEDRESCLINDEGRRETSSALSIKNLPYERPNLESFPELNQKRVQSMKVVRKSPVIAWISEILRRLDYDEYNLKRALDSLEIKSPSWSLGGTWCSWDEKSGTVDADTQPEFEEFDKILEAICPEITFLEYKKLMAECCTIRQHTESDYYGGSTENATHVCDIQKLYDCLIEINIISV